MLIKKWIVSSIHDISDGGNQKNRRNHFIQKSIGGNAVSVPCSVPSVTSAPPQDEHNSSAAAVSSVKNIIFTVFFIFSFSHP